MAYPNLAGVHLLPATGEFVYDPTYVVYGFRTAPAGGFANGTNLNSLANPGGGVPDYVQALDNLQAQHPECGTVSLVVAWFFNSTTINASGPTCEVYPTTIFCADPPISPTAGEFLQLVAGPEAPPPIGTWLPVNWECSGLTQASPGLIPLPTIPGTGGQSFIYGGTPSDPSIVRCIQDLHNRGLKVVFYPFLLSTADGQPWRGEITLDPSVADMTSAATAAVGAFMGSAAVGDFTQGAGTVAYSGSPIDWTYRRMILHYANLCCVAGGIELFVIGSELRALEAIRGPNWNVAGQPLDSNNCPVWDNPFVTALKTLAADVRSTFTASAPSITPKIAYSADWSSWMGKQYAAGGYTGGQWPILDALFADANIDFVSFDNYLPLTDWTTGAGGADAVNWSVEAYSGTWPPPNSGTNLYGLGMSGPPTIYSLPYIKSQIEGGQYFNWFYNDGGGGAHASAGFDPNGSGLMVSLPGGDRLAQARNAYSANQQILANKQIRWWWNNSHFAIWDNGDGNGWTSHPTATSRNLASPQTQWAPNSKSILTLEYGCPAVDKGPNQPNVFFAIADGQVLTTESATPFWSIWNPASPGVGINGVGTFLPRRDDTIAMMTLEAIYEYWITDNGGANNPVVGGVPMLQTAFCCAWNWDARPFPTYPAQSSSWTVPIAGLPGQTTIMGWGDTGSWSTGDWLTGATIGGRVLLPPPPPSPPPSPGAYPSFPSIATLSWSMSVRPKFSTLIAQHVSGRETRGQRYANPYFDIELTYEVLRSAAAYEELQDIAGFFAEQGGQALPFWVDLASLSTIAGELGPVAGSSGVLCRFAEDVTDFEEFMAMLFQLRTLRLTTVRA